MFCYNKEETKQIVKRIGVWLMQCDYCGAEMNNVGNMFVCDECFTTYILKEDMIEKKYIVTEDFAKLYARNKAVFSSNNNDKKYEIVQRLLLLYSNSPALWNLLGVIYRGKNMLQDALNCYEKALNLNPDYTQVLVNSAIAYYSMNNLEKANKNMERAYDRMSPSEPNYSTMLGNYALILGKMGDLEQATKLINEAEARGYKNAHIVRRELNLANDKKENSGKGFWGRLMDNAQNAREDAAVKKAYEIEVEKRKPHIKRVRRERALTLQEQHTIDMIEMERNQKIAEWSRQGVGFFEATFTRALPYDQKIEEIRNRAIWYEEITIPPEVDPSVPIVIDEEAVRKSVR